MLFDSKKEFNIIVDGDDLIRHMKQFEMLLRETGDVRVVLKILSSMTLMLREDPRFSGLDTESVIQIIENLFQVIEKKCDDKFDNANKLMSLNMQVNKLVDLENAKFDTSQVLSQISGITRYLKCSQNRTGSQATALKIFEEVKKIQALIEKPNIEVQLSQIINQIRYYTKYLERKSEVKNMVKGSETEFKKIIDGFACFRNLLDSQQMRQVLRARPILHEIQGMVDILAQLPPEDQDQRRIQEAIEKLKGISKDSNSPNLRKRRQLPSLSIVTIEQEQNDYQETDFLN